MLLRHFFARFSRPLAVLLLISVAAIAVVGDIDAQGGDEDWSEPINLSKAGSSNSPQIVIASDGTSYILWIDQFVGYLYTSGNGSRWSAPESIYLPVFANSDPPDTRPLGAPLPMPDLYAGPSGRIHALWRDNSGSLLYSSIEDLESSARDTWSPPLELAANSLDHDFSVDRSDNIHAVYVRHVEDDTFPAGVYYRRSRDGGASWNPPRLLFESPYLRSTPTGEANVDIVVTDDDKVVVSFDNRLQGRVYSIRSTNGGTSWGPIVEVDNRRLDDLLESVGPQSIRSAVSGETLHRYWLAGHGNVGCAIYGQILASGKETWPDPERLFEDIEECPSGFALLNHPDGYLILLIETDRGVFLSTFDGVRWSDADLQESLTTFMDPQTIRPVVFECLRSRVFVDDSAEKQHSLVIAGCDTSDGGDIWVRARPLPEIIPAADEEEIAVWNPVSSIATTSYLPRNLILLTDADGFLHSFWNTELPVGDEQQGIYYSRWDGLRWSQPSLVLASPSGSEASSPDIAIDELGRLAATWGSNQPGNLYFSQVSTSRAALRSEWLTPYQLPVVSPYATEPQFAVDRSNNYYIIYTVPLNETRGVYMVRSNDGGSSWLAPVSVFDAIDAGWEAVGQSRITVGADGTLHALWTQRSLPPDDKPLSLSYSRSNDAGLTWSEPVEVSSSAIVSSKVTAIGDRVVHIVWLDDNGTIWHQNSSDTGDTWTRPIRAASIGNEGTFNVEVDGAGQFHLLSMADSPSGFGGDDSQDLLFLSHWIWSDDRWNEEESLDVEGVNTLGSLAGAIAPGGDLALIFSGGISDLDESDVHSEIFFSSRQLELPQFVPTPLPQLTPTPTQMPDATPTAQASPTPQIDFSSNADQGGQLPLPVDSDNPLSSSLLGIIPAGLVVLVVFFVGVRILRRERH